MKTITAVLAALFLIAVAHPAYAQDDLDGIRLANLKLGSHVTGPAITGKDLRGKVVVVEYWGITCGPCIAAIPHTTELAAKHGHDKLIIIANQSWNASDRQCKDVWTKHAKNNDVVVVNRGSLPGFRPRGVPHAVIFDHTGKAVWSGHPGGMDRPLAEAVAKVPEAEPDKEQPKADQQEQDVSGPEPIVSGIDAEHFKREIDRINGQYHNINSTLAYLRRVVEQSSNQGQVDEAKAVLSAVEGWVAEREKLAKRSLESDPTTAYVTAKHALNLLRKDPLGDGLRTILNQISEDKQLLKSVKANIILRDALAHAEKAGLSEDKPRPESIKSRRDYRNAERYLRELAKYHADTEAGKRAAELRKLWGMDE